MRRKDRRRGSPRSTKRVSASFVPGQLPLHLPPNAIAPGPDRDPDAGVDETAAPGTHSCPRSRSVTRAPADITEAAAYLCSPAAGYVTGVVLDVEGGFDIAPRSAECTTVLPDLETICGVAFGLIDHGIRAAGVAWLKRAA
ncbi:SDR family oxidoreductase [Nocardia abscessus]|uniref:SDR family oxidoreductase n=1 Tax=Nocardia abscessus TaxID=120957 RepID=UPI0024583A57|nr:SDR family oxidoreductase [Nocardia abscessus]